MHPKHHKLLMILCCVIPLVLLLAVYIFGVNNKYLFWGILLLCPLMHFLMMPLHKHDSQHTSEDHTQQQKNSQEQRKGGGCH